MPNELLSATTVERLLGVRPPDHVREPAPVYGLRGPHRDLVRVSGTDDPRYVLVDHGDGIPALTRAADVQLLPEGIDGREAVRMHLEAAGLLKPNRPAI